MISLKTDGSKEVKQAIDYMNYKFRSNENGQKVVSREIATDGDVVHVCLKFVFPSFLIPAGYVFIIGLVASIILGKFAIITGLIGACLLLLSEPFRFPRVVYLFFVRALRKHGYHGTVKYLGGTK